MYYNFLKALASPVLFTVLASLVVLFYRPLSLLPSKQQKVMVTLMGEGFILLSRGYGFMGGGVPPPFDTLRFGISTDDIILKLYR